MTHGQLYWKPSSFINTEGVTKLQPLSYIQPTAAFLFSLRRTVFVWLLYFVCLGENV